MVKISLATWKYLNKVLFLFAVLYPSFLLGGCSEQSNEVDLAELTKTSTEKGQIDYDYICDFSKRLPYPVEECTKVFLERLESMPLDEKKFYQKHVAEFETARDKDRFWRAVGEYPEPSFLFQWMDAIHRVSNPRGDDSALVGYDMMENSKITKYQAQNHAYQIIARMLEQQDKLTPEEIQILNKSKSRAECLDNVLSDLSTHPEKTILNKEILDKCYKL